MARLEDGRICFVQGALPGELCKVEILRDRKDFTRGRAVQILEPSPDRAEPKCPRYGRCGGCSLQHLDSEKQARYLEQVERENFRRISHAELPGDFKIHVGPAWGYRNRARVVFEARGGKVLYGFRRQDSNELETFESCPVLTPAINKFLKEHAEKLYAKMLEDQGNFEKAFHKKYPRGNARRFQKSQELELNVFDNGRGEISYYYKAMSDRDFEARSVSVTDVDGHRVRSDASVFFQSNLSLLPQLVRLVQAAVDEGIASGAASDEWLIDLYSGVGLFAVVLRDRFKRITTVELNKNCLKHAKVNLGDYSDSGMEQVPNASLLENVSAPAEEWLADHVIDVPATLIVDPPRTGLLPSALEAIVKSSVNRLVYVSCDPVTLARDYAKFSAAGFSLKKAEGFAFYPQTPHLEMLFVLAR